MKNESCKAPDSWTYATHLVALAAVVIGPGRYHAPLLALVAVRNEVVWYHRKKGHLPNTQRTTYNEWRFAGNFYLFLF